MYEIKDNKFLSLILSALSLLSLPRVFVFNGTDTWSVNIISHFPFQIALLTLMVLLFSLRKRVFAVAFWAGILFVLNASQLTDLGTSVYASVQEDSAFKICSANINKSNRNFSKIVSELTKIDADILLLLEVTDKNIKPIQSVIQQYPNKIKNLNIGSSGTGTVLLSRYPILDHRVTKYSEFGNMLVSATIAIGGEKVLFYGAHFPKPTDSSEFPSLWKQIMTLAREIDKRTLPVILAGDLNSTPYSPLFRELMKVSGLQDSRAGFGWQPTWPAQFPPLFLPIDHILVSHEIKVHDRETGGYIGSDHFPVVADLSLTMQ